MDNIICLKNVYKIYNKGINQVNALDNVSLTITKGEFISIVGQSGSGKTTLMNIIGCLDVACSGKYYFEGTDVSKLRQKKLSKLRGNSIGFIFQKFHLISVLTAVENVELPMYYLGVNSSERRKRALLALEQVGLKDRISHKPFELSGGQQQRVAIARAIASNPSVLLADEPTGNLDSASGFEIINILKNLNEQGKTVLLITHNETTAAHADRCFVVHDGKIK